MAEYQRLRRYGITQEQYLAMLERQGNACSLCLSSFDKYRPHIDHCHATGLVRGILCVVCNTMLGRVERVGIDKVAAYLRRNE